MLELNEPVVCDSRGANKCTMDVTEENLLCKPKKACKRTLQDDDKILKKKAKFNDAAKKKIEHNASQENIDLEENNLKDVSCNDKQDELNGKSLRTLLSSSNSLDVLRKFVTICKENKEKDLAAEYLLAGGSVLEVVRLLDSSDKKNIANTITVFSAINILLMRILAKYPQHQNSSIEACRYLLNSHMSIVHSMFSSHSNVKQRKVVLKLLAAIVSLDGNLSKELLTHLSLHQQILESLVHHSKHTDPQSVRTCFIHFVLAFLVEGNTSVIRSLLDKHNLLSCIFPDLVYDSKDIVNLVLSTVKTYVLQNMNISKTTKLYIFSTPVMLNLVSLYNWKGSNWHKNKDHSTDEEFLENKQVVNEIVHEFLIVLLTSHRYGIIFHDRTLGSSQKKYNQLVYTVLQNLEKPWECEKLSDLVLKIMRACPDLIRSQYSIIEPFLEPRVSPKWISLLRFVNKIIESIDPTNCIKNCSLELNAKNLINTLLSFMAPSMVIKAAILPGLSYDSFLIRHEALTLLLSIIHQLKIISLAAKEFYKSNVVQKQITDFIVKNVPNLDMILQTWNYAFEVNTNMKESTKNVQNLELMDHLDIILNILHLYKEVCPELLDNLTDLQPKMLLSNLNRLHDKNDGEGNMEKLNCMKVKTIQFLLVLDSTIFTPKEKIFKEVLFFLIFMIREQTSLESYEAARMLLNATGLFETCNDQLDIWINGFSIITDPKESEELAQWFMSVIKSAIKHTDKYVNNITQAETTLNEHLVDFDIKKAEDIINELFDKANRISSSCKKDASTESSLINGQFNLDAKNDNAINDTFNRSNEKESKEVSKYNEMYVIKKNGQDSISHTKKMEDVINQLFSKAKISSLSFNGYDKVLSPSLISEQMASFNIKQTDHVTDNFENFDNESLNPHRMQAYTSVSPLLCCALHKVSEKNCSVAIVAYISYILVHTLHHQVVPDLLINLATDLDSLPVYKYLQGWLSNGHLIPLKNKLKFLKLLHKTSNALLANSKMDITEVFKTSDDNYLTCCFKYDNKEVTINHSLSLYNVKTLLRMTVFYLAQLAQRGILKQIQNENCKLLLIFLLNIIQSMNQENMKCFTIIKENAQYIFTHPILLHYFSPFCEEVSKDSIEDMITKTILEICETVMCLHEKTNSGTKFILYKMFFAFREKYLTQLEKIIKKCSLNACSNDYVAIALLKILQLRTQDIVNLLLALMKLRSIRFFTNNKQTQSIFGCIVPILLDMYCDNQSKLLYDQYNMLDNQFVTKLGLHLLYLKSNKIKYTEKWEQSLIKYLSIFPHNITGIDSNIFAKLLKKDITKSTVQLIMIIISRNIKLIPLVMKYFLEKENRKQADIVFPILGCNLKDKWSETFLQSLYHHYSSDIAAYLSEPRNPVPWIEENTAAIIYLIENTFDLDLCEKICGIISQSGDKFDMVSICFVHLLESLYKKYESLVIMKEKTLSDLIQILLHIMTLTLKKEAKNLEKIKILCEKIDNAVACLRKIKSNFIFNLLSKSHSWSQYTRFSLKLGLKDAKNDDIQSSILKTLNNLCDIVYADNIEDEYVKKLFEMATSHSEFVNVMLESSVVKENLIELLRILTRKNHSVMSPSHVPLYLAAYNATLTHVDQRILQILQHYESHGVKLEQYWPYLWGNAAASRYAVKGEMDTALWRQPSTSEILNLFDKDIIRSTIKDYPIHRTLKDNKLYEHSNVYDPAFYLPLLCSLLTENNVIACYKINQSDVLALVFIACCSSSNDVRLAAYTIISRYYFHIKAFKSKEKWLWIRLIDALRNGVVALNCPLKDVRLSCLVATFLARTSLITSHPLHPLYSSLHTFLMAKPALDLTTIPELLQLLHSSHVEHKIYRYWILENIRDGMKVENDVDVALKCMLFRMLLDFHTCTLSDTKTRKLILEIIASTTKISKSSILLIQGYGVLPWLHEIVNHLDIHKTEIATITIIIENLLNSLSSLKEDTTHYKCLLFSILLQLKVQK